MKLIILGRYEGKKIIHWPLAVLWVFLVELAAILAAVVMVMPAINNELPFLEGKDLSWFPGVSMLLAVFLGCMLRLWLRWRKPVEELPDLENATSRLFWIRMPSLKTVLQLAVFGLVCLATLIGLFYTFENWRGKRAFLTHKRDLEARGEALDWQAFVPPMVPDDQNLAMTPLFRGLLNYDRGPGGTIWHDQSSAERLAKVEAIFIEISNKTPFPGSGDLARNQLISLSAHQAYFRQSTNVPHATAPQTAAEEVLLALSTFEGELKELKQAVATHPFSRFPIHYEDTIACLLPHLTKIRTLVKYLNVHAIASLEAGRTTDAFEDLQLSYRLTDTVKSEPFLISQLVRIACSSMSTQILKEGLVGHRWTEDQLRWMEDYCLTGDVLGSVVKSLKAERSFGIASIDLIRRGELPLQVALSDEDNYPFGKFSRSPLAKLIPSGWYYQNMLSISRFNERYLQTQFDASTQRIDPQQAEAADLSLQQTRTTPFNLFARRLTPAMITTSIRTARWQTTMNHAAIACALERYRLAHREYPAALDALRPKFMESMPHDVVNGEAYRYERSGDDYVLYSVGWNLKDDGGRVAATSSGKTVDGKKGDWVWSLTPTPPVKLE
jgi:hypothetical protein